MRVLKQRYISSKESLLSSMDITLSNAYNQVAVSNQIIKYDGFINEVDRTFLKSYAVENLMELLGREHLNQY